MVHEGNARIERVYDTIRPMVDQVGESNRVVGSLWNICHRDSKSVPVWDLRTDFCGLLVRGGGLAEVAGDDLMGCGV